VLQLGHRRESGAEVVERTSTPSAWKPRRMRAVFSGSSSTAYSVISMQRRRRHAAHPQATLDELDQVVHDELGRGHVDANDEREVRIVALPDRQLAAGLDEDPAPDVDDEPRLLGDRDEVEAASIPLVGCCQRTSASTASRRPVARSTSGWKWRRRPSPSMAWRSVSSVRERSSASSRISSSKMTA